MTKKITKREKDPAAIKIGNRIKQARKMEHIRTQALLQKLLPKWTKGRVAYLEAGFIIPHPNEIQELAKATKSSACWIMFGIGPIRSAERDLQAIRHQNLVYLVDHAKQNREWKKFISAIKVSAEKIQILIDNPFQKISGRLANHCESYFKYPRGWLDQQQIESDKLSASFPDDMRELMSIYSGLDDKVRKQLLNIAKCFL